MKIRFVLNGEEVSIDTPPERRLVDLLRINFGLTETRASCMNGSCGSCLILMDNEIVPSCIIPAFAIRNTTILTIEGFTGSEDYEVISRGFSESGYQPCPFCSPGIILRTHALLEMNPNPDEQAITEAFLGSPEHCSGISTLYGAIRRIVNMKRRKRGRQT